MDIGRTIINIYQLFATIPPAWLGNPNLKWQMSKNIMDAFLRHFGLDPETTTFPETTMLLGIAIEIIENDQINLVMEVK